MTKPKVKPPRVEVKTLDDLEADPNNVNRHTAKGRKLVSNSIQRRGAFRSIAAVGKGVKKPVVMAGGLTREQAREAGINEVIFVHTNGKQLVSVVRDDIAPGSAEAVALGLEDNEAARQSYNPDVDILAALAEGENAVLAQLRKEDQPLDEMINVIFDLYGEKEKDDGEILLDQAIQLEPSREYMVVMCADPGEWDQLRELFKLKQVRRGGYRKGSPFDESSIQRVIHAAQVLELFHARGHTK